MAKPYGHIFLHEEGTFTDMIDFTIPAGSLGSSANPLNLALGGFDVFNIANLAYSVYGGTSEEIGGKWYGTYLGNNTSYDLPLGMGGAYHIVVNGLVTTEQGGAYAVALVSGVPEPETYAMLLGGLGLMGVVARRRKSRA
ncbi:PEP-CTERM sorting domain-containing protein [Duganella sp. SAP-35]|uniref:PEP-CTERM sorting domain-containing protein n=2 Tax=Duganella aceris TaxID=2703883 RepID=A0ABX0FIW0_9BURK|nr:PEP-CTERM sorting domain-containing protein [Duganella aceris]